jgi:hypothetical protein
MNEISLIQDQIRRLTEIKRPEPLAPVPMMPNLARGSAEMWQYYQYQLKIYEELQKLPSEKQFLEDMCNATDIKQLIVQRLSMLIKRDSTCRPVLLQPITSVKPLSHQEKVERAKLIAKHLTPEDYDPIKIVEQIKQLQYKLMELEDQYLT